MPNATLQCGTPVDLARIDVPAFLPPRAKTTSAVEGGQWNDGADQRAEAVCSLRQRSCRA